MRFPAWTSYGFLRDANCYFVSIQLEQSIGGNETLATNLDTIVDLLRGDACALDTFMTKMANMGWSEEMRDSGELLRFFVRSAFVYVVDEDFPRLPDDFMPSIWRRVGQIYGGSRQPSCTRYRGGHGVHQGRESRYAP